MAFTMNSAAFTDGHEIPSKYTRDGENLSPPLEWSGEPTGTQSFLLVVDDPDAPSGLFQHWAAYNIGADQHRLPEGASAESFGQGVNDFGNRQYDGPEPPKGDKAHHYHFRLAALSTPKIDVPPQAKVADIWEAARPHMIGEAECVGTYAR
ncbi:YbhB/YbcL family Raf kinase inhibitor-like protein [Rhodospirillaceae bacterium SYSU D60014]|uniref:YbhB/YbcL family Raf kinase inhibitor-like protein n=1 Tax=Virgifigura deserti TaxID=2268457 RepID=UPI000E672F48